MSSLLILCLSTFLSVYWGCSHNAKSRFPATTSSHVEKNVTNLEALIFKTNPLDLKRNATNEQLSQELYNARLTRSDIVLISDDSLTDDLSFKVNFSLINDEKFVVIHHNKNALKNVYTLAELINFIFNATNMEIYHGIVEIYANALQGDKKAIEAIWKFRTNQNTFFYEAMNESEAQKDFEQIKSELDQKYSIEKVNISSFQSEKKAINADAKKLEEIRKKDLTNIDKLSDDQQFKNLIAKNDRQGVADLIKLYLPFEQMAPVEKNFWQTYLMIMANPVSLDQRVLVFRGLNDDMLYTPIVNGVEWDKKMALQEGKAFFMSSIITKNQGTWNRRLRSLQSMSKKFIGTDQTHGDEYASVSRMTTMFQNHSQNPQGSPFLSFSPDFKIATFADSKYATDFGSKRVGMFLVDPRLLHFNHANLHDEEKEFLTVLCTFPDELAGLWDINTHKENPEVFLYSQLKNKLIEKFGEKEGKIKYKEVITRSKEFYSPVYNLVVPGAPKTNPETAKSFKNFLAELTKNVLPLNYVKDKSCTKLVEEIINAD